MTCARQRPDADLFFITGADALAQILGWRDTDELFELAHFIGVTRPGYALTDPDLPEGGSAWWRCPRWRSPPPTAATGWHRDPVWYLVPDGVVQYINKRGLYRGGA